MKKLSMIVSAVASVGLITVLGTTLVSAHSRTSNTNLVNKIAQRFNLKTADVQAVFDQNHKERQAVHKKDQKTHLDQAVKDGKLTQDQENKLFSKQAELMAFRDGLKDKSEDEKHTAIKAKLDETRQWLKDNNISEEVVYRMVLTGQGGREGHGMRDDPAQ